ncbi:MAG: alanine racemase [Verrucomicrobiota bacterium]
MLEPEIVNLDEVPSPALLVEEEVVRANIGRAVEMADGVEWMRPHIKTHKSVDVLGLQREAGIEKFKCATMAEAELAARAGAEDVLVAMQPVGPAVGRLLGLVKAYPDTRFRTIGDDAGAMRALGALFAEGGEEVDVLLDIDCGMGRTGVESVEAGALLYGLLGELEGLRAGGFHFYDGHVTAADESMREEAFRMVMGRVREFERVVEGEVPLLVGGGSPTFAMHAREAGVECSPGTFVFWDAGYGELYPELPFEPAAWLLSRVVSRPGVGRVCLDLGHKAVAAERELERRVVFPGLSGVRAVLQSEEHLVMECEEAEELGVGREIFGVPWHICPTVALYGVMRVVRGGRVVGEWRVEGRDA